MASGMAAALICALRGNAADVERFKLGVITDEITQDFESALVWAKGFGLHWVELRFLWNKYVTDLAPDDVKRAQDLLAKHNLKVSVIDSAYFKTVLPGTESKFAEGKPDPLQSSFSRQNAILEQAIARAKDFGTDKVRIFAFLRVSDPHTVFDRVAKELQRTASDCPPGRHSVGPGKRILLQRGHRLRGRSHAKRCEIPGAGMNWDPGNAYAAGETPFPNGYEPIPKNRMWHMHLKDAAPNPNSGDAIWMPIGSGKIDYVGQFRALIKNDYQGTMSLETHYLNAAKNKEQSSRESMEGLLKVIREA